VVEAVGEVGDEEQVRKTDNPRKGGGTARTVECE
jgi:hypothetical protein